MKKYLMTAILTFLALNILMLSLALTSFAQDEDATEASEVTETVESDDSAAESEDDDSGGTNVAVFIGIGIAIAAGVFTAIYAGTRQTPKEE